MLAIIAENAGALERYKQGEKSHRKCVVVRYGVLYSRKPPHVVPLHSFNVVLISLCDASMRHISNSVTGCRQAAPGLEM